MGKRYITKMAEVKERGHRARESLQVKKVLNKGSSRNKYESGDTQNAGKCEDSLSPQVRSTR